MHHRKEYDPSYSARKTRGFAQSPGYAAKNLKYLVKVVVTKFGDLNLFCNEPTMAMGNQYHSSSNFLQKNQ